MSHGYYVERPDALASITTGCSTPEPRLGSLIAIGKGDVPEEHWFAMVRTYPPEADWQTQRPQGWRTYRVRGHEIASGYVRVGRASATCRRGAAACSRR